MENDLSSTMPIEHQLHGWLFLRFFPAGPAQLNFNVFIFFLMELQVLFSFYSGSPGLSLKSRRTGLWVILKPFVLLGMCFEF